LSDIKLINGSGDELIVYASGMPVALFGKVFGKGLYILGQILLARFLGPGIFGLYAVALSIFSFFNGLLPFGLDNGVIHFASQSSGVMDGRFKSAVLQAVFLASLFGLFGGGILFLAAPWLANNLFEKPELLPLIYWFAAALPFSGVLSVLSATTRISRRIKYTLFAQDVGQPAVQLALMLIFYFAGFGLAGLSAASAFSYGLAVGLSAYFVWGLFGRALLAPSKQMVKYWEYFKFSFSSALASIFSLGLVLTGRLLVGYFCPSSDAGIYQAASQIAALFPVILSGINALVIPMISGLSRSRDVQKLEALFRVSTKWSLYLNLPLLLIAIFAPDEIMRVTFGQAYAAGAWALGILTISQVVNAATGPVGSLLIMTNHPREWAVLSGCTVAFELGLGVFLTHLMGLNGAAIAVSLATAFLYSAGMLLTRKVLHIWPYDRRFSKLMVASFLSAAILLAGRVTQLLTTFYGLCLMSILTVAVFALWIYLQGLDEEDRQLLEHLKKRLGFSRSPG